MVMVVMRMMTTFTEKAKDRRKDQMGGNKGMKKSKGQNFWASQPVLSLCSARTGHVSVLQALLPLSLDGNKSHFNCKSLHLQ